MSEWAQTYDMAAASIRRFTAAMERAIHDSVAALAPRGRQIAEVQWGQTTYGDTTLTVTLDNGDVIRGVGEAKLEAIASAALFLITREERE